MKTTFSIALENAKKIRAEKRAAEAEKRHAALKAKFNAEDEKRRQRHIDSCILHATEWLKNTTVKRTYNAAIKAFVAKTTDVMTVLMDEASMQKVKAENYESLIEKIKDYEAKRDLALEKYLPIWKNISIFEELEKSDSENMETINIDLTALAVALTTVTKETAEEAVKRLHDCITTSRLQESKARDWADAKGVSHMFATVNLDIQPGDDESINALYGALVELFVKYGFTVGKVHYIYLAKSPSQTRSAEATFIREEYYTEVVSMVFGPVDYSKLPPEKYEQILTLWLSTTMAWEKSMVKIGLEKFDIPEPTIDEYAVMANFKNKVEGEHTEIDLVSGAVNKVYGPVEQEHSDGFSVLLIDDAGWEDNKRKKFHKKARTFAARPEIGMKGAVLPLLKSDFKKYMVHCKVYEFTDFYGKKWTINDLPSYMMAASVFKLVKVVKTTEQWDAFKAHCKMIKHGFRVTIIDHSREFKDIPAQGLQSMAYDYNDVSWNADTTASWLKYIMSRAGAPTVVGGVLGKMAAILPEIMGLAIFEANWKPAANARVHSIKGGRVPNMGHYTICMPDPRPIFYFWLTGNQPRMDEYGLHNGEVANPMCPVGIKLASQRMPNNDCNWSVNVVVKPDEFGWMYSTQGIYFSCLSLEMTLKQMDYDGDKVFWTSITWVVSMIKTSIAKHKIAPIVLPDMPAPKKKEQYSRDDQIEHTLKMIAAPVGLCSNACSMAWSWMHGAERYRWICIFSAMSTLVIDAAKHPFNSCSARTAQELIYTISQVAGDALFSKEGAFAGLKMPTYHVWAKSSWTEEGTTAFSKRLAVANEKYRAKESSVDNYSNIICQLTEKTGGVKLAEPVELKGKESYAVARMLTFAYDGEISNHNGVLTDMTAKDGWFDKITSERLRQYHEISRLCVNSDGTVNRAAKAEAEENLKWFMNDAFEEFVDRSGVPYEEVFDWLIFKIFSKNDPQQQRTLLETFPEEIWENFQKNMAAGGLEKVMAMYSSTNHEEIVVNRSEWEALVPELTAAEMEAVIQSLDDSFEVSDDEDEWYSYVAD